jgi:glycosyltransferase involved in cell wall biosynthesis
MAAKLPLLLSNISSFREQCEDTAFYFDVNSTDNFCQKLENILRRKELLTEKKEQAYQRMINNFTLMHHLKKLRTIYDNVLSV